MFAYKCSDCGQNISFATSRVNTLCDGKYWSCKLAAIWGDVASNHVKNNGPLFFGSSNYEIGFVVCIYKALY